MNHYLPSRKGGSILSKQKDLTEHLAVETLPIPEEVEILLNQHFGAPCKPLVKKKDQVAEGDVIGVVEKGLGAAIHSSVTGNVKTIGVSAHPIAVKAPSVIIETDSAANPRGMASL